MTPPLHLDARRFLGHWLAITALLFGAALAPAQTPKEQEALQLLNAARKASQDKNFPAAVQHYKQFLAKHADHRDLPLARHGLALSLLELPDPDSAGAAEQLQLIAANKDLAEHASVLYHLGVARRGLGLKDLARATGASPEEAAKLTASAAAHFNNAATAFAGAADVYATRAKKPDAPDAATALEWSVRARCDQAEMLLRNLKAKEARTALAPLLKDPAVAELGGTLRLALYYDGVAAFALKDYQAAGRSLSPIVSFGDALFGTHARFLLARVHHLEDERAEATGHYEGLLADYEAHRKNAAAALRRPEVFRNPREKARLEALVKGAPPEHVAQAQFYLGVLQAEAGKFGDAQGRFVLFLRTNPRSPLAPEATLRLGICLVQAKQYAEAVRTLQLLADKHPTDQVLLWLGKAQAGNADPNNPGAVQQALKRGMDTLRQAADKARADKEPDAKTRCGAILFELADLQQQARQSKEAAATLEQIQADKLLPAREQEVLQRLATALNLAGDYAGSDKVCDRFVAAYPKSPLLPAVLFRRAENAAFRYLAAEKDPNLPNRQQELDRLGKETEARAQDLAKRFPEFEYTGLARYGLALSYYRKGDLEKTLEMLAAIPASDRTGEVAAASLLQAECLIRLAPIKAEDAIAAGKIQENMQAAIEQLDSFVSSAPRTERTAEALLKLGYCHQRMASLLAKPQERTQGFQNARLAYKRIYAEYPQSPVRPYAMLEEAKCFLHLNAVPRAMTNLSMFTRDPFRQSPVAPMALLQLATLLRSQNKAADAANLLGNCREQYGPALAKDPARAGWLPLIVLHHGICLKEAGKLPEARAVFEQVGKEFPTSPEAPEAALRRGQCLKDEGLAQIEKARQELAASRIKPEEFAASFKTLREATEYLDAEAGRLKDKPAAAEPRARMLYEAAWGHRHIAGLEHFLARTKLGPDQPVPMQPSEQKARTSYLAFITAFPEHALTAQARLELAEMLADRSEFADAAKQCNAALDSEPSPELTERIRLCLGSSLAGAGNVKAALAQFDAVARNAKSPLLAQAHFRAGDSLFQAGEWAEAMKRLGVFRDQDPFRNQPGLTDRALLLLGHAAVKLKQWDRARQAYEQSAGRFGNSQWAPAARYGLGWACEQQKDYEAAVRAYSAVAGDTASPLAPRAQLQVGLCRLEQKRYPEALGAFEVVWTKHKVAELTAIARLEAARAQVELKQKDAAEKLLGEVERDPASGKWADAAKQQLKALKDGAGLKRPQALADSKLLEPTAPGRTALPMLGVAVADRASLDDPTTAVSLAAVVSAAPPARTAPAPFLRLSLPDPFEHHYPVRLPGTTTVELMQTPGNWPLGS